MALFNWIVASLYFPSARYFLPLSTSLLGSRPQPTMTNTDRTTVQYKELFLEVMVYSGRYCDSNGKIDCTKLTASFSAVASACGAESTIGLTTRTRAPSVRFRCIAS